MKCSFCGKETKFALAKSFVQEEGCVVPTLDFEILEQVRPDCKAACFPVDLESQCYKDALTFWKHELDWRLGK